MASVIADMEGINVEACKQSLVSTSHLPAFTSTLDKMALNRTGKEWNWQLDQRAAGKARHRQLLNELGPEGYSSLQAEWGQAGGGKGSERQNAKRKESQPAAWLAASAQHSSKSLERVRRVTGSQTEQECHSCWETIPVEAFGVARKGGSEASSKFCSMCRNTANARSKAKKAAAAAEKEQRREGGGNVLMDVTNNEDWQQPDQLKKQKKTAPVPLGPGQMTSRNISSQPRPHWLLRE